MGVLFSLKKVCKSFALEDNKQFEALNDIDFDLPEVGMFFIYGKSGSGETTLLNIMEGLLKPTSGEVLYKGKNILKFTKKEKQKFLRDEISIIFQSFNLINDLTVVENINITMKIKKVFKKEYVDELIEKYHLKNVLNNKAGSLSGGEKQRLCLIRALISDPSIIFADEPTGNLDEKNSCLLMEELKEISKNHLIIIVTHNMKLLESYNDGLLELINGKISKYKSINNDDVVVKEKVVKNNNKNYSLFLTMKNYQKNIKKNLVALFSVVFTTVVLLLCFSFSNGINKNIDKQIRYYQNYNVFEVSKITSENINNSSLNLQRVERIEQEDLSNIVKEYESQIDYNLNFFFKNITIKFNNEKIENLTFQPIFNDNLYDNIYVNDVFASDFKATFNKTINNNILNFEFNVDYEFYNKENKEESSRILENFSFSKNFEVKKVFNEFKYLSMPTIYYSFNYFKNILVDKKAETISKVLNKEVNFYSLVNDAKNNDEITSYSLILYLKDFEDCLSFYNNYRNSEEIRVNNNAFSVINSFKDLSNSLFNGIIFFIFIALFCSVSIIGFLSYSNYSSNRKLSAILTSLGAKDNDIFDIYVYENMFNMFGVIIGFLLSRYLVNLLNKYVLSTFFFNGMFDLNMTLFNNDLLYLFLFLLLVGFFLIYIFSLLPLLISKKIDVSKELKEE